MILFYLFVNKKKSLPHLEDLEKYPKSKPHSLSQIGYHETFKIEFNWDFRLISVDFIILLRE